MPTPAELLEGLTLDSGWFVVQLLVRNATQTGGAFSTSYRLAKPDGSTAFLKAMDFQAALSDDDPAARLKILVDAFVFEREIIQLCGSHKLSRIVRAIGSGTIKSREVPGVSSQVVQYLIFELAEGDLRQKLSAMPSFDLAWTLKCLHEIFVAAQQLHVHQIVHQDIKPSNILGCGLEGAKLADLGRAWHPSISAPHDSATCAGALAYAAPEILYSSVTLTQDERRYGSDFYLLGSMIVFMFSGLRTTACLLACLPPEYNWNNWKGEYKDVLPYLEHAFAEMLQVLEGSIVDEHLCLEIVDMVRQMCDPDVKRRGDRHHKASIGSRFGLQRFVSKFYMLHLRAKIGKIKAA